MIKDKTKMINDSIPTEQTTTEGQRTRQTLFNLYRLRNPFLVLINLTKLRRKKDK